MSDALGFFWLLLGAAQTVISSHSKSRSSLTSMSNHFLVFIHGVGAKGTVCNNFLWVLAMLGSVRARATERQRGG